MTTFIPGLELNRLFFQEAVRPILASAFPNLAYSAALIGYGSDVLGYDTERSTDHEWGPRLLLFLNAEDVAAFAQTIDATLQRTLPSTFRGYSTGFSRPDLADGGVRRMEPVAAGSVSHHIRLLTLDDFLICELGVTSETPLTPRDWLTFPEQKLLEVTAGAVFHDGLGRLGALRQRFEYYPHDVWLYRMSAQWQRIAEQEAFMGRCGEVGDELGSRLVAVSLIRDLMRLSFLLERQYAPYSKWFGTAFTRLACAVQLGPLFARILAAQPWQERDQPLAEAYRYIARQQNALDVAAEQDPGTQQYFGRPYTVIRAERFARALAAAIQDEEIKRLANTPGLLGAIDQWVDNTAVLTNATLCRRLGELYSG